jgi:hypothetical protein
METHENNYKKDLHRAIHFNPTKLLPYLGIIVAEIIFISLAVYTIIDNRSRLKKCEDTQSMYCPFFTCEENDPGDGTGEGKCYNRPWRCLDGSDTCVGDNKVCMNINGDN